MNFLLKLLKQIRLKKSLRNLDTNLYSKVEIRKFAYFPKIIEGKIIWLKYYYEEWQYTLIYFDICPLKYDWFKNKTYLKNS